MTDLDDRAKGALVGLAVGDALGMPTQMLSRRRVHELFPELAWFEPGPEDNRISAGRPAGEVTDDTQQALMLAHLLVQGAGHVDPGLFVARLAAWAEKAERDGTEQLGPSSRLAVDAMIAGAPITESGRRGSTNGAAMRVTPVGIATPAADLVLLVDRVEETCLATHHTGLAMSGAAAVAAAVSAGLDGASFDAAVEVAGRAAAMANERGHYVAGADVAKRIGWATRAVAGLGEQEALDLVDEIVGTGVQTQESVPAAFALASVWPSDPWAACLAAAGLGGDSDTVGSMVGAIVGAGVGVTAFPAAAVRLVEDVNGLDLSDVAASLLHIREGSVG